MFDYVITKLHCLHNHLVDHPNHRCPNRHWSHRRCHCCWSALVRLAWWYAVSAFGSISAWAVQLSARARAWWFAARWSCFRSLWSLWSSARWWWSFRLWLLLSRSLLWWFARLWWSRSRSPSCFPPPMTSRFRRPTCPKQQVLLSPPR